MPVPTPRAALGAIPLFASAEPAATQVLRVGSRVKSFARGEILLSQGAPGNAVMALVEGHAKVAMVDADGRATALTVLGAGDVLGELAVLGARTRVAQVTALGAGVLLHVDGRSFMAALEVGPRLGIALARMLAQRVRAMGEHLGHITALEAHSRVVLRLRFLVERFGEPHARGTALALRVTQQDLAELCDLSRQTTNQVLRTLVHRGVLVRMGRRLVVPDVQALQAWGADPDGV